MKEKKVDKFGSYDYFSHNEFTRCPDVSVVMGVYNGAQYLREAIESILNQTFINFEFIIIDDGSSDEFSTIVWEYIKRDSRIVLITQDNIGLTKSLIRGIDNARGVFVARQDADDISLPGRLGKSIAAIGSSCLLSTLWYVDDGGGEGGVEIL
jgi:glycosyltransferase involved in cell wall biosynthesis